MHPELLDLLEAQGGALTRAQLLRHHTPRTLRDGQTAGILRRAAPGVFVLEPAPADIPSRVRRAELALGVPLIACGPTAGLLHGLPESVSRSGLLHVTTDHGRSMRSHPGVRVRQMTPRSGPVLVAGVRATPLPDTAIDLAMAARAIDRLAILDAAAALCAPEELLAAADRARGRRGLIEVRRLAPHACPLAESPMESRTRQQILEAGFPEPEMQLEFDLDGMRRRVDLAYLRWRIAIEYDGEEFHTGSGALRRDRLRHNQFVQAGWTMIYLTADDIYLHPQRYLGMLGELLRSRLAA